MHYVSFSLSLEFRSSFHAVQFRRKVFCSRASKMRTHVFSSSQKYFIETPLRKCRRRSTLCRWEKPTLWGRVGHLLHIYYFTTNFCRGFRLWYDTGRMGNAAARSVGGRRHGKGEIRRFMWGHRSTNHFTVGLRNCGAGMTILSWGKEPK